MKQCPVCKNTYTDTTLQFCLADGATLYFATSEQPTQQFSGGTNPIRINTGQDSSPTIIVPPKTTPIEPVKKEGSGYNLIIGLVGGFIVSAILAAGLFSAYFWFQSRGTNEEIVNTKPTPNITNSKTPTPTPDETENLKEKIANLEKQMQEQKKNTTVPTISNPLANSSPQSKTITAQVNTPGDGFLALRTEPSAESGERILQIPHGSKVTILGCLAKGSGKKGRWCRVNYNGNVGWAYDGFLIY